MPLWLRLTELVVIVGMDDWGFKRMDKVDSNFAELKQFILDIEGRTEERVGNNGYDTGIDEASALQSTFDKRYLTSTHKFHL